MHSLESKSSMMMEKWKIIVIKHKNNGEGISAIAFALLTLILFFASS